MVGGLTDDESMVIEHLKNEIQDKNILASSSAWLITAHKLTHIPGVNLGFGVGGWLAKD